MSERVKRRKQLYRSLQNKVGQILGQDGKELRKYQLSYAKSIDRSYEPTHREELFQAIGNADFVLLGDFHSLEQSQRTHLRVLKGLRNPKQFLLAVECIESKYQGDLDRFLAGRMPEKVFLKKIRWAESWGVPWESYRPLFEWAKENGVGVFAMNLNADSSTGNSLQQRDNHFAQNLVRVRKSNPRKTVVFIVGELHLAPTHLPKQLKRIGGQVRADGVITIIQNPDEIYFQLMEKRVEHQIEVIRFDPSTYAVLSITPWIKWQCYLNFVENQFVEIGDGWIEEFDFTDQVAQYIRVLASDLGMGHVNLSDFSTHFYFDRDLDRQLSEKFSPAEIKKIALILKARSSLFLPELKLGVLGKPSENQLAMLAMSILHSQASHQSKTLLDQPAQFLPLVWIEIMKFFGAKLINPKRKSETLFDLKELILAETRVNEEEYRLAFQFLTNKNFSKTAVKIKNQAQLFRVARLIGGVLGEKLYQAFARNEVGSVTLQRYLKRDLLAEDFEEFFGQAILYIRSLPEPFLSKNEKV